MAWLEIIGAMALYVVALVVSGYTAGGLTYFIGSRIRPHGGLEALMWPVTVGVAVVVIGAIGGLIWLGTLIAS